MSSTEATPSPEPVLPQASKKARHGLRWLLAAVGVLALLLVTAAVGIGWALRSEAGTAWVLTHVPGVQVDAPKGLLLGDFEARRVQIKLPGGSNSVTLTGLGWRGLSVSRGDTGRWLHVVIDELHASRIDVVTSPSKSSKPLQQPADLKLPLELEVRALRVDTLYMSALGDRPLEQLQARLHVGASGGSEHRIDQLSLGWDRLQARGTARIASAAPMQLDAALGFAQSALGTLPAWSASVSLNGPIAAPVLLATVRTLPAPKQAAQSLDARATLRPFAAWPLGDLQASTQALDLSAFSSAAPVTSLSGRAVASSSGLDQPASVEIEMNNASAGRWNEQRLPLRRLTLELGGRPGNAAELELRRFEAELGSASQAAGRITGSGRWSGERWNVAATLDALQPALLDARAATMQLAGPINVSGTRAAGIDVKADLQGQLADRGPARTVQIKIDTSLSAERIEVRDAQVLAGSTRASLTGLVTHPEPEAPWRVKGQAALVDFDPALWWPGPEDSSWRKAANRLNGKGTFDLAVPAAAGTMPVAALLAGLRGEALATLANSMLAGVPLKGELALRSAAGNQAVPLLTLDAAGNSVRVEGHLGTTGSGANDRWDVALEGPALNRLAPLLKLLQPAAADSTLAGSLSGSARLAGRWPVMTSEGQLDASGLRFGAASVQRAQAKWRLGTLADAPAELQATLTDAALTQGAPTAANRSSGTPGGGPSLASVQLQLKGSARAHTLELRAESKALPPAWTDALRVPAAAASATAAAAQTVALLQAQGGIVEQGGSPFTGWRGTLQQVELRDPGAAPLLRTRDVGIELQWAGSPAHATVQPGRAEVLGGVLRWSRIAWRAAEGPGTFAQIEASAQIEPLRVAPLLARAQPAFGWGGDLAVGGTIELRSAPDFRAAIVLERSTGDLTVTDELGTQALGLTDLRLALNAADGVWSFTQALAGKTLGVAAGAVVARTSPQATWPAADTPIEGVLELQVASLGTWGTWVPPGWRLDGALRTSASIGGRLNAPEYTGEMRGTGLSVRNFLQGVNLSDGDVLIALQGSTARIERFTAKGGAGSVKLEGSASLGEAPKAVLKLSADKFQLLGRVDRRIVTSGQAQMQLDSKTLSLDGSFSVDEGAIDFTRSEAPTLSSDVEVVRARGVASPAAAASAAAAPNAPAATAPASREVALDLRVNLGEKLRIRGRGIDTGLRGELHITSPNGRLSVTGTVRAADGTYAAYGQKLTIDRSLITFNGPVDNPRLDIEATRPNLDVRVGVAVTGNAVAPRIRLFSEPELSEIDKLSWLVMGRASDGLGRTDTALLQRAALALLAGEGEGVTDQFTRALGLDAISLRQSDGEVRDTVISLGKQLSRNWYVGYERGLNATTGSWQLIYRIAQRFTLRAQSGLDNSLDLIWTWRWQ
ncbi:MAG: translocation/assembly module TamB domain-containing protein [Burkholderiales bacterium]